MTDTTLPATALAGSILTTRPGPASDGWTAMTDVERVRFEHDGYLVIPGALTSEEVAAARTAVLRLWHADGHRGGPHGDTAMHRLSAVSACPELALLIDHPTVFRYVWSLLGWNVHIYHSHVDVHPQLPQPQPDWWHWHQDGGRQNRELETTPRPRMSVKLAYWLSDVSYPDRGNLTVIPGSHRTNWLPGPPSRGVPWPQPARALQITANPGDVVVFDRRLWHARSDNHSPHTRIAAFFGYTYRWVTGRDHVADLPNRPEWATFTPVQRQLLGGIGTGDGDHAWGHDPATTPLYAELANRNLLDSSIPALIP
ncbi:phytanoyl-CoA dioxygenase family protein [Dactylosporangium sp. NPDC005572]|uniref:phytanoyl-CoA dioxygenase family protein n=1 Tax=Dactylosporangium sp. NPDC005572 TaxID=3156889 RepID=UPI0033B12CBD